MAAIAAAIAAYSSVGKCLCVIPVGVALTSIPLPFVESKLIYFVGPAVNAHISNPPEQPQTDHLLCNMSGLLLFFGTGL